MHDLLQIVAALLLGAGIFYVGFMPKLAEQKRREANAEIRRRMKARSARLAQF